MTGVQSLKMTKIKQKAKSTYQLKVGSEKGVDDGCTR